MTLKVGVYNYDKATNVSESMFCLNDAHLSTHTCGSVCLSRSTFKITLSPLYLQHLLF